MHVGGVLIPLQVKKIAPVFQVQASTIYLVREFEKVAVFPHEASGRFNRSLIDITAVYAVHGEDAVMGSATPQRAATTPTTPFGAYTGPSVSVPPGRTPVISRKANSFRKTVALVSLTSDHSKPSTSKASGIQYKIITKLIVTLEAGHCSLATVAESINQQVGFPVVLLDSKCYRIIESSTTNSTEFWKSNRKILAASLSLYDKLKGTCSTLQEAVNLTVDDDAPRSKRPCVSRSDDSKLEKILERVYCLQKKSALLLSTYHQHLNVWFASRSCLSPSLLPAAIKLLAVRVV